MVSYGENIEDERLLELAAKEGDSCSYQPQVPSPPPQPPQLPCTIIPWVGFSGYTCRDQPLAYTDHQGKYLKNI